MEPEHHFQFLSVSVDYGGDVSLLDESGNVDSDGFKAVHHGLLQQFLISGIKEFLRLRLDFLQVLVFGDVSIFVSSESDRCPDDILRQFIDERVLEFAYLRVC